jgi:hypothetical protein
MASSELQSIAKNAVNLLDLVRKYSEQDGLQAWQQSKITKAADYLNAVLQSVSGEQSALEGYGRYDRRDAYQRDYDHSVAGMDRPSNHRDDERHDLDPSEWYIVKDGKMFKVSVYPNQEQEARARGYSPSREEAKAMANNMGEDHSDMGKGFGKNGYHTAQSQRIHPDGGNVPVAEDEYMAELFNKLAEKIPANAPVDVWIKDFQKANPNKYHQFKNKTPEKKAQMAVAASYGAKNPSKKK